MANQAPRDAGEGRFTKGLSPGIGWIIALPFLCKLMVRLAQASRWDEAPLWIEGERVMIIFHGIVSLLYSTGDTGRRVHL